MDGSDFLGSVGDLLVDGGSCRQDMIKIRMRQDLEQIKLYISKKISII